MDNQHIKPAMEIHTTKFHDPRQFLPSRDVAKHIHFLVYEHLPAYIFKNQKNRFNLQYLLSSSEPPLSHIFLVRGE